MFASKLFQQFVLLPSCLPWTFILAYQFVPCFRSFVLLERNIPFCECFSPADIGCLFLLLYWVGLTPLRFIQSSFPWICLVFFGQNLSWFCSFPSTLSFSLFPFWVCLVWFAFVWVWRPLHLPACLALGWSQLVSFTCVCVQVVPAACLDAFLPSLKLLFLPSSLCLASFLCFACQSG